jgi:hypothetical protein
MLFAVWAFMWSWLPRILETPTGQQANMSPVRLRHIPIKAEELYVSIFDCSSNSALSSKTITRFNLYPPDLL